MCNSAARSAARCGEVPRNPLISLIRIVRIGSAAQTAARRGELHISQGVAQCGAVVRQASLLRRAAPRRRRALVSVLGRDSKDVVGVDQDGSIGRVVPISYFENGANHLGIFRTTHLPSSTARTAARDTSSGPASGGAS